MKVEFQLVDQPYAIHNLDTNFNWHKTLQLKYSLPKGKQMNDQITEQMAGAHDALATVEKTDKTTQEQKTEVFVQEPTDVGTEEKSIA